METYENIDFTYGEQPTEAKWDQLGLNDKRFNEVLTYGWQDPGETWTYASATTFTISGDVTSIYEIGDKIRYKQGGDYKYGIITNKSYGSPNTTITISGEAITNAAITDNYCSKINSPVGMGGIGVLGYAEITANFTTATTDTYVDVTNLTATVTVPAGGRKVKITAFSPSISTNANSTTIMKMGIREGTTTLNETAMIKQVTTDTYGATAVAVLTPTAGSHTYKVSVYQNTSGTLTLAAAAATPAFILVEYI